MSKDTEELEALTKEAEEKLKAIPVTDPTAAASTLLLLYTPKYNALVDSLSANAMRRLLKKVAVWPITEKAYKATSEGEQMAYAILENLTEAKFVLKTEQFAKSIEEWEKQQVVPEGETNGN